MFNLFHIFTRRSGKGSRHAKIDLLGSNPIFYKVLSVDKKIYKIKRRKWN